MFAARKMQTAAKRDDELIIRSAGQIVTRILVTGAPGFVGRALHSIEVIAVEGELCDLDPGQGISIRRAIESSAQRQKRLEHATA